VDRYFSENTLQVVETTGLPKCRIFIAGGGRSAVMPVSDEERKMVPEATRLLAIRDARPPEPGRVF
jgi:hypothetical protein